MSYHDDSKLSNRFLSLRKKIDKTATSACLQDNKNAEIFVGLTNALFASLIYQEREKILQELGNPKLEISWHRQDRFRGNDIVEFAMKKLNRSRIQATRIVGERLGIRPENCFDAFPITQNNETNNNSELWPLSDFIPENIDVGNKKYKLSYIDEQKNFGGEIEQEICCYSTTENDCFFLIASKIAVQEKYETKNFHGIGYAPATALAFSRVAIDKSPDAHVIFPMSLPVAFHLRRLCRKDRIDERSFIVSGHFGGIDALDLKCFQGRKVILLPEFSHDGLFEADRIAEKLKSIARDVKIYPWPIMADGMPDEAMTAGAGSPWKQTFLEQMIDLREELAPSSLLNRITNKALSISDFKEKLVKIGLSPAKKGSSQKNNPALPPASPALTPAKAFELADVTLYHTMRPGSYVMIAGKKGAGKTQVALSACHSILNGNIMWPFFSGAGTPAGNVAYIDAETPYDEFCANLDQHCLAGEQGKRFFGLSIFAPDLPEFCDTFSLENSGFREGLTNYLQKNECRFVFFDNLSALMGDKLNYGNFSDEVLEWVKALQSHNQCVVFVHHKSEDAEANQHGVNARGSHLFTTLARTFIGLVSSAEILNGALGTEDIQKAAARDGLTVGLRFDVSKPAPILEKKTFWLHLPLGASEWEFLAATGADGQKIELPMDGATAEIGAANNKEPLQPVAGTPPAVAAEHNLSPDQRRVFEILKKGPAKRKKIQKEAGFYEDKIRELLKSLIELGLVNREGQGKATYYTQRSTS